MANLRIVSFGNLRSTAGSPLGCSSRMGRAAYAKDINVCVRVDISILVMVYDRRRSELSNAAALHMKQDTTSIEKKTLQS